MFMVHGIWSISTPIALVEACVPDRARTPWLGRVGLAVVTLVFLLGATAAGVMQYKQDPFVASMAQFIGAAVVIVLLVIAAFLLPVKKRVNPNASTAPSAWIVGAAALVFGSTALFVPKGWGWGAVAALLALDAVMLALVVAWSRLPGWGLRYQLALGAGAALAYGWHAFLQHPAVGKLDASVRVGNAIFLAGAVGLIWFAARQATTAGIDPK
jgi:hypothetical protein